MNLADEIIGVEGRVLRLDWGWGRVVSVTARSVDWWVILMPATIVDWVVRRVLLRGHSD